LSLVLRRMVETLLLAGAARRGRRRVAKFGQEPGAGRTARCAGQGSLWRVESYIGRTKIIGSGPRCEFLGCSCEDLLCLLVSYR
jgi:hypothetical protein